MGTYLDDEGRVYVVEEHRLTILNGQSGEVLNRKQLKDMPARESILYNVISSYLAIFSLANHIK